MSTVAENTESSIDAAAIESMTDSIMNRGYIFQDYTKITDQETEAAYALALQLIDQRQYAKAERIFELLCYLDHFSSKYWLGLGVSRQLQSKHKDALPAYALAWTNDIKNPAPPLRAAECFLALNRLEDAENGASAAIYWADRRHDCATIKARAELLLENIRGKKENQQ